jgi:hypothetical protein
MVVDDSIAAQGGDQPAIVDLECAGFGVVAHHALNAVELLVSDQEGNGFRVLIGIERAPLAALQFAGAVMRLIGADEAVP